MLKKKRTKKALRIWSYTVFTIMDTYLCELENVAPYVEDFLRDDDSLASSDDDDGTGM